MGALVVGELRKTAEFALKTTIKQAVMSVPAEFTELQRNATIRAGNLAGLEVLRLLSEPTAAAMAYGLHKKSEPGFIVVFDFGGGTLDVSLLSRYGGMFSTYAVAGNKHLGGEDLSHALYLHGLEAFAQRYGHSLVTAQTQQALRSAVEKAKLLLSSETVATMLVELNPDDFTEGQQPSVFELEVTRAEFESLNSKLFAKIMAPLHTVRRMVTIIHRVCSALPPAPRYRLSHRTCRHDIAAHTEHSER